MDSTFVSTNRFARNSLNNDKWIFVEFDLEVLDVGGGVT